MPRPYVLLCWVLACLCLASLPSPTAADMPKPEDDFGGYMDGMAESKAEAAEMRERFERHRVRLLYCLVLGFMIVYCIVTLTYNFVFFVFPEYFSNLDNTYLFSLCIRCGVKPLGEDMPCDKSKRSVTTLRPFLWLSLT